MNFLNYYILFLYFVVILENVMNKPIVPKTNHLKAISELEYSLMKPLERCFLWSKTIAFRERVDYLVALRRKVINFYAPNKMV